MCSVSTKAFVFAYLLYVSKVCVSVFQVPAVLDELEGKKELHLEGKKLKGMVCCDHSH